MKPLCPICRTEMIERSSIHVCPRNDIGDCPYDALNMEEHYTSLLLNQSQASGELRSYSVSDTK